uniref:AlNc14C140G7219 protein n=1 Tax=Albugo laibachii Nc14 TaxID=890382 RepID=F0WL32_9STRA|nr:AlNc14C140G7219 [Albugo laibachii Nc14]|eukprot:CCA21992.1 AlNc14C140G7219 [Albugo laibachii Nc14]
MILTNSDVEHHCHRCRTNQTLRPKICVKYLNGHAMEMEIHPPPPASQHTDELTASCFMSYHQSSGRIKCSHCIKKALDTNVNVYKVTKNSFLIDTTEDKKKLKTVSVNKIPVCHKVKTCKRIQMVPVSFYSEHRAFVSSANSQSQISSEKAKRIHTFTDRSIPVGVWPPKTQQTASHKEILTMESSRFAQSELASNIRVWAKYNSIAFLEFASEKFEQERCLRCLIQHTEVFFVYISGYVWMRQAPTQILKFCVGEHCAILTQNEVRSQIERPDGLRQCTASDFRLIADESKP